MGFTPSKAEAGIWIRENSSLYEYTDVYVDNLLIAARDPNSIVQTLQEKHKFKGRATIKRMIAQMNYKTKVSRDIKQ
jgi:hypothetical protein